MVAITEHVAKAGNRKVLPTPALMAYWFHRLNAEVFDEWLPTPAFSVGSPKATWGLFTVGIDDAITVHLADHWLTKEQFLDILVHELVHLWQYIAAEPIAHGPSFTRWAPIIKARTGLTLRKSYV